MTGKQVIHADDERIDGEVFVIDEEGEFTEVTMNPEVAGQDLPYFAIYALIPTVIGMIAAAVLYLMVMSGWISGELFPRFTCGIGEGNCDSMEGLTHFAPTGVRDYAKALVWGFAAWDGRVFRILVQLPGEGDEGPDVALLRALGDEAVEAELVADDGSARAGDHHGLGSAASRRDSGLPQAAAVDSPRCIELGGSEATVAVLVADNAASKPSSCCTSSRVT